jgi:hypothetical protein
MRIECPVHSQYDRRNLSITLHAKQLNAAHRVSQVTTSCASRHSACF